jgi:hypothetical protein
MPVPSGKYGRSEYGALPVKPVVLHQMNQLPIPDVRGVPTADRRKLVLSSCFEKTNWPADVAGADCGTTRTNLLSQMAGADLHRCGNDASDDSMIHWMRRLGGRCAGRQEWPLLRCGLGSATNTMEAELAGLPVKSLIFPNTVAPPAFRCYRRPSSSPRPPASAMAHSDQPALHRFSFES